MNELITQDELIRTLKVNFYTFKKYCEKNNIKSHIVGKKILYNKKDFKMFLLGDEFVPMSTIHKKLGKSRQRISVLIKKYGIQKYKFLDNFDQRIYIRKSDLEKYKLI
jgi:hypothetical protein